MHMRENLQAFQLTGVKLPSRTLASKAPTEPNETTFSIKSVFNNIRCQAGRCQPSWVSSCQSIWMVIGWWIELLSKQIPRQRSAAEFQGALPCYLRCVAKCVSQREKTALGNTCREYSDPHSSKPCVSGPFSSVLPGRTLPRCLWGGEPRPAAGTKGSFAGRRWALRAGHQETAPSKPNLLLQSCGLESAIIKTNKPDPQLAQSHRNSVY